MPTPDNETKIRECVEIEHIFSEWECDFLESIDKRVRRGAVLSEKQQDKLNDLYRKACESPE